MSTTFLPQKAVAGHLSSIHPTASFVPFRAKRIARPQLEWINPWTTEAKNLSIEDLAFCMPTAGEPEDAYLDQSIVCYAERYGGEGIGSNGGGVRCGLNGALQIKGIGRNPLAGTKSDFWHTHGSASLEEGIQEAVWGEVCNIALPFGAVRVHALITTATSAPYRCFLGDTTSRRALIIRDAALRPAHYMRAVFYHPTDAISKSVPDDVSRTRLAVRTIRHGLSQCFNDQQSSLSDAEFINSCMDIVCQRYARQIAAARAKRIFHGTLNASNICLDGRWIDFGTISTLSDYGRIKIGRNQQPDMWLEHTTLIGPLKDFAYYLYRYLPAEVSARLTPVDQLLNTYLSTCVERAMIEMVKLTGLPEHRLITADRELLIRLYMCMKKIMVAGNGEPFKLDVGCDWRMPAQMGRYSLNKILTVISLCGDPAQCVKVLAPLLPEEPVRTDLVRSYWDLRDECMAQLTAQERPAALIFLLFNALRLNTSFADLYRTNIEGKLKELSARGGIDSYIAKIVKKATTLLADPIERTVDVSAWFSGSVKISEQYGILRDGISVRLAALLDDMDSAVLEAQELRMARDYAKHIDCL